MHQVWQPHLQLMLLPGCPHVQALSEQVVAVNFSVIEERIFHYDHPQHMAAWLLEVAKAALAGTLKQQLKKPPPPRRR